MNINKKYVLVTTIFIVLGLLIGYQVFVNAPVEKTVNVQSKSESVCWNSLTQSCSGSCSTQNDCGSGYICISISCPFK